MRRKGLEFKNFVDAIGFYLTSLWLRLRGNTPIVSGYSVKELYKDVSSVNGKRISNVIYCGSWFYSDLGLEIKHYQVWGR